MVFDGIWMYGVFGGLFGMLFVVLFWIMGFFEVLNALENPGILFTLFSSPSRSLLVSFFFFFFFFFFFLLCFWFTFFNF